MNSALATCRRPLPPLSVPRPFAGVGMVDSLMPQWDKAGGNWEIMPEDLRMVAEYEAWLPARVFDAHAHIWNFAYHSPHVEGSFAAYQTSRQHQEIGDWQLYQKQQKEIKYREWAEQKARRQAEYEAEKKAFEEQEAKQPAAPPVLSATLQQPRPNASMGKSRRQSRARRERNDGARASARDPRSRRWEKNAGGTCG